MPDPTDDINFKKALQNEINTKQKRSQIIAGIVILVIILTTIAYFFYKKYNQPKIQPEVLPNTSLSDLNKSNLTVGANFNSPSSTPPKPDTNPPANTPNPKNPTQTNNPKSDSLYYAGKIDGKIPFRIKLDYNGAGAGNAEYTGQEVYDGVSEHTLAIKARTVNNPSPDYCPDNKCNFSIQEFDNPETDPDKILALDNPVGDFQGTFDVNDTKMNKITGTWTKGDGSQKLKFELNRSVEFNINDFTKTTNQNYRLKGDCGAYVEKTDSNDCILVDLKTGKTLYNFDKENGEVSYLGKNFKHGGNSIVLGKQKSNELYVLSYFPDSGSSFLLNTNGNMGTMGFTLNVSIFNLETKKMNSIRENQKIYLSGIDESKLKCKDPYQDSRYTKTCYPDISASIIKDLKEYNMAFKETEEVYGLPNQSFKSMKF